MDARRWAGSRDTRAIQDLASRLWPLGWHPGGLGWALARGQLAEEVVLFEGPGGLSAWAGRGMDEPGYLLAQVDPDQPGLARTVVDWFLDNVTEPELTVEAADEDTTLLRALRDAGFQPSGARGAVLGMRRRAGHEPNALPAGYSLRSVETDETQARVEVHRAAWLPGSLPYAAQHRPPPAPGATSSFTEVAYQAVRETWLYRPEFDLVAVGPEGDLAAGCIAWFDAATGVAEIEPLGVAPEHRGQGLAGALCVEVAARVADVGGREVFINTGPLDEYPAPGRAYVKAGFEVFRRASTYVRNGVAAR